jgi:hypothetical protein
MKTLAWIAVATTWSIILAAFFLTPTPSQALFDTAAPGMVQIVDPTAPNNALGTASHPLNMTDILNSQYPTNSVPETGSATGTTTAFTASLPVGTASQTEYVCGAEIDAAATAGVVVAASITGTKGGALNFLEGVSTLASAGNGRNVYTFNPCIPASAANTPIVVNAGAAGTAGIASISAWGYLL